MPFCRIVLVSAPGLKPVESKRVDIYVWSTAYQTYFKVALKIVFVVLVS